MAVNPNDLFVDVRTGGSGTAPAAPAPAVDARTAAPSAGQSQDIFSEFRVSQDAPLIRRENNSLGEEFVAGLNSGIQGLQGSLFGVAGMFGRELGIDWMEKAGNEGAERNFAAANPEFGGRQSSGFSDIESAGGFYRWFSATLGEAIPSLALAMTGGGIGAVAGRKAVEMGVKKSIAKSVERRMTAKFGFSQEESLLAAREYMLSDTGRTALTRAFTQPRTGALIAAAEKRAVTIGTRTGVISAAAAPITGQIDQELLRSGVADPGLTALLGGVAGGALEAVPALRLIDKMFPGVDRQVSKQFVKDFAVSTGTQAALEGSTEAAQEMITLAALAYHDPSFDMFSPDARKRVIDAFAAGAAVGTVTGGGAEAIGAGVQAARGARNITKAAVPAIGAWSMDTLDKAGDTVEGVLPEGFTPADKTVFQEIRSRIYGRVQPHIESAVNSLQAQVDKVTAALDTSLEGGVNAESATISEIAKAAHNKFLQEHGDQIQQAKDFMDREVARITQLVKDIPDPEARAKFVTEHTEAAVAKLSGFVDMLRRKAAERNQRTEAEVDNMEFPDHILAELAEQNERDLANSENLDDETQEGAERVVDLGEPGDVDAPTTLTFGKFQKTPTTTVTGKEKVRGYDDEGQAKKGLATLRNQFPESTDEDFEISQQEDGTFIIETVNPELRATAKFNEAQKKARQSRREERKYKIPKRVFENRDTGFNLTTPGVDVVNLAHAGRDQDPDATTLREGIESMAAEMLARGYLDTQSAQEMLDKFDTTVEGKRDAKAQAKQDKQIKEHDVFTTVTKFPRTAGKKNRKGVMKFDGVAMANMMNFINKLEARGIKLPFGMLQTRENADGTYSWGIPKDKQPAFRALRAKDPSTAKAILDGIKHERRQETLATASQKNKEFSGNAVVGGPSSSPQTDVGGQGRLPLTNRADRTAKTSSGDIGDTSGRTTRNPDVEVLGEQIIQEGTMPDALASTGQQDFAEQDPGADKQRRLAAARLKLEELQDEYLALLKENASQKAVDANRVAHKKAADEFVAIDAELGQGNAFPAGRPEDNVQRTVKITKETRKSQQGTDRKTDPDQLPSEFEERNKRTDDAKRNQRTGPRNTAKKHLGPQTKHDQALLKHYGKPGGLKVMLGLDFANDGAITSAIKGLVGFVQKTLGLSNQVTVMDDVGLSLLIETGAVSDPIFDQTLNDPNVHARNIRIGNQSFIYLSPKILSDPAATVLALGHELGHHVYRVAWDNLTDTGKLRLYNAYQSENKLRGRFQKLETAQNNVDGAAFNEWMADQLAGWITQRAAPKNAVEAFFSKVGGQVRRLYDMIAANPRFQLNETFSDFADAVALKARTSVEEGTNPFNEAILKAWFRNEGVTMYKWFGDAMEGKDQGPKPQKKSFEPHTIAERQDMLYRRGLELDNLYEEQDVEGQSADQVRRNRKRINELQSEMAAIQKEIAAQIAREEATVDRRQTGAQVDNMAFDFAPVTAEGKKALARVESKYPAIVKRAVTLRNWVVNAYKLVLSPSTSVIRSMPYKAAQELALIFNRALQGVAKGRQNYHQAVNLMRGQFTSRYTEIRNGVEAQIKAKRPGLKKAELQTLVNARMREIGKSLQAKDGDPSYGRQDEFESAFPLSSLTVENLTRTKKNLAELMANPRNKQGVRTEADNDSINQAEAFIADATAYLARKKKGKPFTKEEQAIRNLFDDMHKYATEAGLPVRKVINYYPRTFSRELLEANKQMILDHLSEDMSLEKARSLYNSLIDPNANDGRATFDATETPGFRAMNSREARHPWFDQFLEDNTDGIVANYVNAVVKRAEFNRLLGEPMPVTELTAKQAIKQGIWDPKRQMHKILADAKKQGATDEELITMEKYIDANLGQLGRDSAIAAPGMRRFMAGVLAYQNMRVLLFTVFASLPDLVGPGIRGGGMKAQWNTLKNNINDIASDSSDLSQMAHTLGIVQDTASEHIMTEYVDNHYMPARLHKWNNNFFKWTGLNWYTDFTRKMALAVGIDYIEQSYNDFVNGKTPQIQARGKDMLAELGLSPTQAKQWIAAGKPTYDSQVHDMEGPERKAGEALVQFVDESIMRPNASQRPILASHPGAMLVFHLKGYMYAVHDIVLKRIKFNIDESESPAQYVAAIAPAIAMMLLTAVGLELRELIQYAGSNRKPPTDRMDGWEYTWELAQRSGLTGFTQIGFDFEGADDRGMSKAAGVGGPALAQIGDFLSKPHTQTIPKAIPVIGQIPAARNAVRTVL